MNRTSRLYVMPQCSNRLNSHPSLPDSVRVHKGNHIKSDVSQEFNAFEKYYDIENTPDCEFRKEHYIVDEFIYKSKFSSNPESRTTSTSKKGVPGRRSNELTKMVVPTYVGNKCLPDKIQSHKSFGPIRSVSPETSAKDSKIDWTKVPMDWDNYHRLGVIHQFMDDLEHEYPSLCTTGVIGKSLENRDLKILKISNSDATNTRVWIDAGIHAREWIAPAVNTFVANHIAKNFDSLPSSARSRDWYFMPVLNPDGYEYSHTTDRMWRKNKAQVRHTLYGVDLNRNFSYGWGGKGSSDEPKHNFYRGPRPFSEPETSAMRDIFLNSGVPFQVYITLHSFGEVIIMPFAYREELAPDYIRLLEGATVMSKAIYDTNGNTYKVGISKDVMYHASGTSNDWSHGAVGIPFCYLIELRSKKHKFKVPKEEIAETGKEILNSLIALMEFIDNYQPAQIETNFGLFNESEDCDLNDNSYDTTLNKSKTASFIKTNTTEPNSGRGLKKGLPTAPNQKSGVQSYRPDASRPITTSYSTSIQAQVSNQSNKSCMDTEM